MAFWLSFWAFPWLLLLAFLLLAIFHSPWWWIAVGVLSFQRALVLFHHRKPWWRIQDLALTVYARTSAFEHVMAEKEGREVENLNAVYHMVREFHPDWPHRQALDFVFEQVTVNCPANARAVIHRLLSDTPNASESEAQELGRAVKGAFEKPTPGLMVRMAVAGLVEEQLGTDQRVDYLCQAFLGNV